jgi:hypothetical protein
MPTRTESLKDLASEVQPQAEHLVHELGKRAEAITKDIPNIDLEWTRDGAKSLQQLGKSGQDAVPKVKTKIAEVWSDPVVREAGNELLETLRSAESAIKDADIKLGRSNKPMHQKIAKQVQLPKRDLSKAPKKVSHAADAMRETTASVATTASTGAKDLAGLGTWSVAAGIVIYYVFLDEAGRLNLRQFFGRCFSWLKQLIQKLRRLSS